MAVHRSKEESLNTIAALSVVLVLLSALTITVWRTGFVDVCTVPTWMTFKDNDDKETIFRSSDITTFWEDAPVEHDHDGQGPHTHPEGARIISVGANAHVAENIKEVKKRLCIGD